MNTEQLLQKQRKFFAGGKTKDVAFRLASLRKLEQEIRLREDAIQKALQTDLGKAPFESYMSEIALVLEELRFVARRLAKWAKPERIKTPLAHFPSKSTILKEPYGVVLLMAPWNYPFMLNMEPLVGAVAAGNCVVVKPSAYAPATSAVIKEIVENSFMPGHVAVVEGGREQNSALLQQRFDYIFFTGSTEVGKLVMEAAAQNLTPVSLELGGKSPCIVDETADIALAGRRIAFGKFLNAGQTCIAPDYLLVQQSVKEPLLAAIRQAILEFFGEKPLQNPELPKIVNQKHFNRLLGLIQGENAVIGGGNDGVSRIAPTVLDGITPDSPVMQEEIFGPVLPVMTFDVMETAVAFVNSREKPLALYLFTTSDKTKRMVLRQCSFGGGCVNDTIVHIANSRLPFGGVGYSGMGSYHGKTSFNTFSHAKSILEKSNKFDLQTRYHPYTKAKEKLLRRIMG